MSFPPKNVRTRLTLWYVLVLMIILFVYASLSFVLLFLNLRHNLDNLLKQDYDIVESITEIRPDGSVRIDSEDDPLFKERWVELWLPNGKLVFQNKPFTGPGLPPLFSTEKMTGGYSFRSMRLGNNARIRVLIGKINIEGKWLFIRLVRSEKPLWHQITKFGWILMFTLPLVMVIAGIGGYLLAKKFLAPVDQMAKKARKISGENLQERLPVVNPNDELGNLALAINELLERIQKYFLRLKQFTSDAAHELRTPLTAIRSIGEVSLQNQKEAGYYRNIIGSMLEENNYLTHLVDSLLFLTRADSDAFKVHIEQIELYPFVERTVEFIKALAEEKNQSLLIRGDKQVRAKADRTLLWQALLNLIDNAIKYSPENSSITVQIKSAGKAHSIIDVNDQGPGIPEEQREKIFDRFYRVDKGRPRDMGGSGLGLAIAQWALHLQGGTIRVENQTGKGCSFSIILPV